MIDISALMGVICPKSDLYQVKPSSGEIEGISTPACMALVFSFYAQDTGDFLLVGSTRVRFFERLASCSDQAWADFMSLKPGLIPVPGPKTGDFSVFYEIEESKDLGREIPKVYSLFLEGDRYLLRRKSDADVFVDVDIDQLQSMVGPSPLLCQRTASLVRQPNEGQEIQVAIDQTMQFLNQRYEEYKSLAEGDRQTGYWMYARMVTLQGEIQTYWRPLGLYQCLDETAQEFSEQYEQLTATTTVDATP